MVAKFAVSMPLTLLVFSGCEKRVEAGNIDVLNRQQALAEKRPSAVEAVKEGLTMKEVEAVLGLPNQVRTGKVTRLVQKDFAFTTWVYQQGEQTIELSFIDGKLQGKVPKFGETPEAVAPLQMKNGRNGVKKPSATEEAP